MRVCEICGINEKETSRIYTPKSKITNGKYMCLKHYRQMSQYGEIKARTKFDKNQININDNGFAEVVLYDKSNKEIAKAIIDIDDIHKISEYKWHLSKHHYAETNYCKNKMHRLIMGINNKHIQIDHINNNRLDNRKSNLRFCNNQQNSQNKGVSRSNTGIIGVSFSKRDNVYQSHIKINYKKISLGQSKSLEVAIILRLEAENKYFGDFAPQKHLFKQFGIKG